MTIEIWSDVVCPFCYIGKRNLEEALKQTGENVEIKWKSFQLNPDFKGNPLPTSEYLKNLRGFSDEQLKQSSEYLKKAGLEKNIIFNQENNLMFNTSEVHKIIQMAKTKNLDHIAEEVFFKAYFTDGRNLNDIETLKLVALETGLSAEDINEALVNPIYEEALYKDLLEAQQLRISGVPFFVLDRKYAISGAQPVEAFVETINKINQDNNLTIVSQGKSCDLNGNCN